MKKYSLMSVAAQDRCVFIHPTYYSSLTHQPLDKYRYITLTVWDMIHEIFAEPIDPNSQQAENNHKMRCPTSIELPPPPSGKTGWPWTEASPQLLERMADGSEWPRISIVTPNYNYGQFIEETIRSVLLQGYPNLEYIIIDGNSTDNSLEIIKKYEPWLACVKVESDRGQSDAINKGFSVSTGALMAWLNSDDLLLKGTLHKIASNYKPGLKWWTGWAAQILQDGTVIWPTLKVWLPLYESHFLHARAIIPQVSTFWNRELWNQVGSGLSPLNLAMDYELWLRFSKWAPAITIPNILGAYRTHDQAKTVKDNGYEAYLEECDRVRLAEYTRRNQNKFIRSLLINFWTRDLLSKTSGWGGWKSWIGRRPIPQV